MAKHTPGPWELVKETYGDTYAIFGPGPHDILAHVLDVLPAEVVGANARLIAAAPDLLAACQAVCRSLIPREDGGVDVIGGKLPDACRLAHEAVSKARGGGAA